MKFSINFKKYDSIYKVFKMLIHVDLVILEIYHKNIIIDVIKEFQISFLEFIFILKGYIFSNTEKSKYPGTEIREQLNFSCDTIR